MLNETNAISWIRGLELISLDFVRPVYAELGVGVYCEETLRGIARDTLMGRYSGGTKALEIDSLQDSQAIYSLWIAPFLSTVELAMGTDANRNVQHWIKYVACVEDRNPWVLYKETLSSWASIFRRSGMDTIGFTADPTRISRELKSAGDLTEPENVLRKQKARAITDWDTPFFTRQGLLEIPEGSDFFPVVDAILLAIDMNHFQGVWRRMIGSITPDDLGRIVSATRRLAQEKQFVFCTPDRLPLPTDQ